MRRRLRGWMNWRMGWHRGLIQTRPLRLRRMRWMEFRKRRGRYPGLTEEAGVGADEVTGAAGGETGATAGLAEPEADAEFFVGHKAGTIVHRMPLAKGAKAILSPGTR